ncbi:MAG: YhjD/YihY/BrkB family envelope integrity protein [Actinomycetota bacterium]|nr:YhjD/YihY/BrkB family envelope integrity protein [Actinomycetota bacterium]
MSELDLDRPDDRVDPEADEGTTIVVRARQLATRTSGWATARFESLRERSAVVDIGMRIYERDRNAGGTLLGSALALRLFLFFLPLALLVIGLAGLLGRHGGVDGASSAVGVSGSVARQIDEAFSQSATTPWLALAAGLIGVATTGRSLTRALVLSSAMGWNLGGRQKTGVRAIGVVVGIVVGVSLMTALINHIREAAGVAVASASFLAVLAVYLVLWALLYLSLPRATTDPAAVLPGAATIALVLTSMQAVSQLYLPRQLENASDLYGALGVATVTLGWFFIIGRTVAFSFAINAVLYDAIGSVSHILFGLPVLRALPRRVPALRTYLDLDHVGDLEREPGRNTDVGENDGGVVDVTDTAPGDGDATPGRRHRTGV